LTTTVAKRIDTKSGIFKRSSQNISINADENESELEPDELALKGTRVLWKNLKIGLAVVVARRDISGRSDWCAEMDKLVGEVGFVRSYDDDRHQALVAFVDNFTTYQEWWLASDTLIEAKLPTTDPLQTLFRSSSEEESHDSLHTTYRDLSIMTARQTVFTLLLSAIPATVNSVSIFGGAKNLSKDKKKEEEEEEEEERKKETRKLMKRPSLLSSQLSEIGCSGIGFSSYSWTSDRSYYCAI
jgi:hypothetical protein